MPTLEAVQAQIHDPSWWAERLLGKRVLGSWPVVDPAQFWRLFQEAIVSIASSGKRGAKAAATFREWLEADDPSAYRALHPRETALAMRRLRHPRYTHAMRGLVYAEPALGDWLSVRQAGRLTDLTPGHIRHLARTGRVESQSQPGESEGQFRRIEVRVTSLANYVDLHGLVHVIMPMADKEL